MSILSKRILLPFLVSLLFFGPSFGFAETSDSSPLRVKISTSAGDIVLALDQNAAPISVKNFLAYADSGFYEGTVFHRVIPGFMIQGGGFTVDYAKKDTQAPIKNEANNGLKNDRGTIAMARTPNPDSATAQFFINLKDNGFLNYSAPNSRGWGYAVFGKVVEGMEVMDKIAAMPTGNHSMESGQRLQNVPKEAIIIQKVSLLSETPQPTTDSDHDKTTH